MAYAEFVENIRVSISQVSQNDMRLVQSPNDIFDHVAASYV